MKRKEYNMCFRKLVLIWHPWGRHSERSSRGISEEHREDNGQPPIWSCCPTQSTLCPCTSQRRVACPPDIKLYLLSLASPAHSRSKADRLSRPISGTWLSLRQDWHKPYMKLHLWQNVQLLLKEHPLEFLLWHLCSRGKKFRSYTH